MAKKLSAKQTQTFLKNVKDFINSDASAQFGNLKMPIDEHGGLQYFTRNPQDASGIQRMLGDDDLAEEIKMDPFMYTDSGDQLERSFANEMISGSEPGYYSTSMRLYPRHNNMLLRKCVGYTDPHCNDYRVEFPNKHKKNFNVLSVSDHYDQSKIHPENNPTGQWYVDFVNGKNVWEHNKKSDPGTKQYYRSHGRFSNDKYEPDKNGNTQFMLDTKRQLNNNSDVVKQGNRMVETNEARWNKIDSLTRAKIDDLYKQINELNRHRNEMFDKVSDRRFKIRKNIKNNLKYPEAGYDR